MAVSVRVKSVRRDIELLLSRTLSPEARSKKIAQFARDRLEEGKAIDEQILGSVPPYETFVDGEEGVSEELVNPDNGTILYHFELFTEALGFIMTELQRYSPIQSGRYVNSHELYADGALVDNPNDAPPASEYVFMNVQPYARKIEGAPGVRDPESSQAPNGVYNVVADLAARRFGNMARIRFSYRSLAGASDRNPAIIVSMR